MLKILLFLSLAFLSLNAVSGIYKCEDTSNPTQFIFQGTPCSEKGTLTIYSDRKTIASSSASIAPKISNKLNHATSDKAERICKNKILGKWRFYNWQRFSGGKMLGDSGFKESFDFKRNGTVKKSFNGTKILQTYACKGELIIFYPGEALEKKFKIIEIKSNKLVITNGDIFYYKR